MKDWDCLLTNQASDAFRPSALEDPEHLERLKELLGPDGSVLRMVEELDLGTAPERAFLATWPESMLSGLQAMLFSALSEKKPISARFAFVAGAGFGIGASAEGSTPPRIYVSLVGPEDH